MVPEGQPRLHTLKCRSTNQAAAISLGARTAKKKRKFCRKFNLIQSSPLIFCVFICVKTLLKGGVQYGAGMQIGSEHMGISWQTQA